MKYFIIGMLFVTIIFPILDGLVNLVVQAIQLFRAKIVLKICKLNKQIEKQGGQVQQQQAKHYGFYQLPEPQEIISEEEFDDD